MDDDGDDKSKIIHLRTTQPRQEGLTPLGIKPFRWIDPKLIPPRPWLYSTILIRGEISAIGGAGGRAKTALTIVIALAIATGRALIGHHVFKRGRVLFIHAEEDDDEFQRRMTVAMQHHGIEPEEIDGWFFHTGEGLTIAHETGPNEITRGPDLEKLTDYLQSHPIDLIVVDPYITSHKGSESSNEIQDQIVRLWKSEVAGPSRTAILLTQHFRKGTNEPGNPDNFRGASSFIWASRGGYTVTGMTEKDANTFNVPLSDRRRFIRFDSAKVNMSADIDAEWYQIVGLDLGNTNLDPDYPHGDNVHTLARWTPPNLFEGIGWAKACEMIDLIAMGMENGELYTHGRSEENTRWAGNVIIRETGFSDEAAARVLADWMKSRALFSEKYHSKLQGRKVYGLFADPANRPGPR